MTSTKSLYSIYHTQMFYLAQIIFIILVSTSVNIYFLYIDFLIWTTGFYCDYKVAGESINSFQQGSKLNIHKIFIISENNSIIFIVFRFFSRKQKMLDAMLFCCLLVFYRCFLYT